MSGAYVSNSNAQKRPSVPNIRFTSQPYQPGSPRGQVSQTIYLPGAKSSSAKMSEQLPPGTYGGASEVNRGIFGSGSNLLVPNASETAKIAIPAKPPVDVGVPNYVVLQEPSGAGSSELLAVGTRPLDAPGIDASTPQPSLTPEDAAKLLLLAASTTPPAPAPSATDAWANYFKQPWHVFAMAFALVFALAVFVFKRA